MYSIPFDANVITSKQTKNGVVKMSHPIDKLVTKQTIELKKAGHSDEKIIQDYLNHDCSARMLLVVFKALSV